MPILQPLTYLAQVRQLPFKKEWRVIHHVFTMLPFSPTRQWAKGGQSHKEIVITGIVRGVVWVVRNRNTDAWLKVVGHWLRITRYTSLQSLAKERK